MTTKQRVFVTLHTTWLMQSLASYFGFKQAQFLSKMSKSAVWFRQLPIHWIGWALVLWVKRSVLEAYHPPPSSVPDTNSSYNILLWIAVRTFFNNMQRYWTHNAVIFSTSMKYWEWFTRGADKSLARPGRKRATATKLAIYSAYSPTKFNTLLSPLL